MLTSLCFEPIIKDENLNILSHANRIKQSIVVVKQNTRDKCQNRALPQKLYSFTFDRHPDERGDIEQQ